MEEELLQCDGINKIIEKMNTISSYLQDPGMVLSVANMPQYKISGRQIESMRVEQRKAIVGEMIQFQTKVNERFAAYDFSNSAAADQLITQKKIPQFDLGPFLSMFPVYKGIQQYYLEEHLEGNKDARKDETTGYTNRDERLIGQIRCSKKWPACLFDFTVTRALQEFFVFKVQAPEGSNALQRSLRAATSENPLGCSDDNEEDALTDSNQFPQGDLRQFISNAEYVEEEHSRQVEQGILPLYFTKYQFTAAE